MQLCAKVLEPTAIIFTHHYVSDTIETHLGRCITGSGDKRPHIRCQRQAHNITCMTIEWSCLLASLDVPQSTENTTWPPQSDNSFTLEPIKYRQRILRPSSPFLSSISLLMMRLLQDSSRPLCFWSPHQSWSSRCFSPSYRSSSVSLCFSFPPRVHVKLRLVVFLPPSIPLINSFMHSFRPFL